MSFLKGERKKDNLLLVKAIIDLNLQKRKHIYACFIDFPSAFSNVLV